MPDYGTVKFCWNRLKLMIDKTKKFSVVETSSARDSESGLTADAERYEQLAGLGVTGKAFSVLEVVSRNPEATRMAEIIRGGIISVDSGQTEAAHSIGMTHWQTMTSVAPAAAIRCPIMLLVLETGVA